MQSSSVTEANFKEYITSVPLVLSATISQIGENFDTRVALDVHHFRVQSQQEPRIA